MQDTTQAVITKMDRAEIRIITVDMASPVRCGECIIWHGKARRILET